MKDHQYFAVFIGTGFLFLLDRLLKAFAFGHQDVSHFITPWFGWEYFANTGIAFSIPFPNALLVGGTPIILLFIVAFLTYKPSANNIAIGLLLIAAGALSNWIDRVLYEITIDYVRVFNSVVNIADLMILIGTVIAVWGGSKRGRQGGESDDTVPKAEF